MNIVQKDMETLEIKLSKGDSLSCTCQEEKNIFLNKLETVAFSWLAREEKLK